MQLRTMNIFNQNTMVQVAILHECDKLLSQD